MTQGANWLSRLTAGLSKTSSQLGSGIAGVFTKRRIDAETLAELEEVLVRADIGASASAKIIGDFARERRDKEIDSEEIKRLLAAQIARMLEPVAHTLLIKNTHKPHVILAIGVNGNGKTTTLGKLAHRFKEQGYSVMLAAADTFRAAAVEQLKIWGLRTGCDVITGEENADPASVAFKAYEAAKAGGIEVLLIDSAGRLHNQANLMAELQKIVTTLRKLQPDAPHSIIQVLDATTGQNALMQVEAFSKAVKVTGLIVTKLDGTAKGGIVVALAKRFGLPVHAVGVGESVEDLRPFSAMDFAQGLTGATI